MIIIIAVIFSSQRTEQPTTSEIVYYFKDMKVKEYTVDFGTGAIELKLNDDKGTVVKATAASITTFLDQINPYVDQYNEKHPDEPMKYDHIRASENSWLIDLLPNIILFGALVVFWIYFMRKLSNGMGGDGKTMGFGKAKIKSISDESVRQPLPMLRVLTRRRKNSVKSLSFSKTLKSIMSLVQEYQRAFCS